MTLVYTKRLRGWRLVLFNICLGVGHAIVLFNAGAYIAMLPRVAGGLGIPSSFATWTQTDYMIGMALAFPVGSWLSRRFGDYQPFTIAFMVFALASISCAYSTNFYTYLAGRVLLGFAGGLTLPLGHSLILNEYPDRNKSLGIGVWSLFTLTPYTLGPPLGGWIADTLGWRWLFLLNIPVALAVAGIVGALLYKRGRLVIYRHFDFTGFILLTIILGGFQTLLNQGNDWDWFNSPYLTALTLTIIIALIYFVVWELGCRSPFVDLSLFAHRNFFIAAIVLAIGFLCIQGLLSLLIIQLQLNLGYSSFLAGLAFLPMAIFAKPMGGIFHEIVKHFDARLLASFNLLGFAAVYFWLSRFDVPEAYAQLFWPKLVEGLCLGSFFVPLTALLLHGLPGERHGRAVELANLMRIAAGAVGIAIQNIILYRRLPFHQGRFAESRTPLDPGYHQALDTLAEGGLSEPAAFVKLAKIAARESAILSMNDAFWIAGCIFTGLSMLVWLAHPTKWPAATPACQTLRRQELEGLAEEA
jgi:DHA2 family multidrug resistance protein